MNSIAKKIIVLLKLIKKPKYILVFLFISLLNLQGCISNRNFIYLQGEKSNADSSNYSSNTASNYKLKIGDVIYLRFLTEDEKLNSQMNPAMNGIMNMQIQGTTGSPFYFMGYSIDGQGFLPIPFLGKVKAENLTIDELRLLLEEQTKKYLKNFYIQIKLGEFRFSILGSVNRPGSYFFMVNHLNILEAISMAGDLSDNAKRNDLILIRSINGVQQKISLDITNVSILNSPYFQVQPNDIIYVAPVKGRVFGNISTFQNSFNTVVPLFSVFLTVLNTYIILQNVK